MSKAAVAVLKELVGIPQDFELQSKGKKKSKKTKNTQEAGQTGNMPLPSPIPPPPTAPFPAPPPPPATEENTQHMTPNNTRTGDLPIQGNFNQSHSDVKVNIKENTKTYDDETPRTSRDTKTRREDKSVKFRSSDRRGRYSQSDEFDTIDEWESESAQRDKRKQELSSYTSARRRLEIEAQERLIKELEDENGE
jgi:hypothetical protein